MVKPDENLVLLKNPEYSTTILPDGKWLFLDSDTNRVVVVTPTAGVFWEHCTGKSSLSEIITQISNLYPEIEKKTIRDDVNNIVPLFIENNLVTKV